MRSLLPASDIEVDPFDVYVGAPRPRPADRPWVAVVMVTSLDGATTVAGVSGDLGGDGDRQVFRAARAMADVILVGAGTVRAENYGPVLLGDRAVEARRDAGRDPRPAELVIVSGRLDLDPDSRVFEAPGPTIVTTEAAAARHGRRFDGRARIEVCGDDRVDIAALVASLNSRGDVVACEGGPTIVGQLVHHDLVDEWCVNIGSSVTGGTSDRIAVGAPPVRHPATLTTVLMDDGVLATRWLRDRSGEPRRT